MAALSPDFKHFTLLVVRCGQRVLLGRKRRGFGEGYFNGFGGKVEATDKSVEEAAKRELREEAGIEALDCDKLGLLTFHFDDKPLPWKVHVFRCSQFEGTPTETEEMSPQWFNEMDIPFDKMWADDKYWYPLLLAGKHFKGVFHFKDTHTLMNYELTETVAAKI